MIEKIISLILLMGALIATIDAHGRLIDPINRASLWRDNLFTDSFPMFEDDDIWCHSERKKDLIRNATCGVCGPI